MVSDAGCDPAAGLRCGLRSNGRRQTPAWQRMWYSYLVREVCAFCWRVPGSRMADELAVASPKWAIRGPSPDLLQQVEAALLAALGHPAVLE